MLFIVVTGGPGAGKTAILEMARQQFCKHVLVLPEAAEILYRGGFWRRTSTTGRIAAQQAIYHVQSQLEWLAGQESEAKVALCDRGTIDCVAYWPEPKEHFYRTVGTSESRELQRYALVLHLRTPGERSGYNASSIRTESASEAAALDEKLVEAWAAHPRRCIIESTQDFFHKAETALEQIRALIPPCPCKMPASQN